MKQLMIALAMFAFTLSSPASAETKYYGIATGGVKGAWYAAGASAAAEINAYRNMSMAEEDIVWVPVASNGALQNAIVVGQQKSVMMKVPGVEGKVKVHLKAGFVQPDVRAYAAMELGIPRSNLRFALKGGTECIWTAVNPKGRVDDMDSLQDTDGATMVVGTKGAGMDTSLAFLKLQDKEIRTVTPIHTDVLVGMNAMSAGEDVDDQGVPDSVSFVMSPNKLESGTAFLTAKSLGLKFIDMDDNQFNNKVKALGNKAPYEFQKHRTPTGKVKVPCMESSLYVGPGVDISEIVNALAARSGKLF